VLPDESEAIGPRPPRDPKDLESAPFTTLVVDGAAYFKRGLREFLESEGHTILTAETDKEALDMTRAHLPDLILLNIENRGLDGLELLPELLIVHPRAAVILMAGRSRVSEAVEAIKAGAVDYLEWPVDLKKLKSAIETQKSLNHRIP
jgi:DNA-binding NtrC family response regulator